MEGTVVQERTTRSIVHFDRPFEIEGFDEEQPAGDYEVVVEEQLIDGLSMIAYRRVGTFIHLPALGRTSTTRQIVPVGAAELEAALAKDRNQT
jgi:hypothetical protein